MRTAVRRLALTGCAVVAVLIGTAGPAAAHATLSGSSPESGATLAASPEQVTLTFDEQVTVSATTVSLRDSAGRLIGTGLHNLPVSADGDSRAENATAVVVGLPPLGQGSYDLQWRTTSTDDLHSVGGSVIFGVEELVPAAASRPLPGGAEVPDVLVRWLSLLCLLVLAGALAIWLLVAPRANAATLTGELRMAVLGAAGLAVLAEVGWLAQQERAVTGWSWDRLLSQPFTRERLLSVLLLLALYVLALHARRRDFLPRRMAGAVTLLAALLAAIHASSSHAVTGSPVAFVVLTIHLVAAAAWPGAVLVLAVLTVRHRRDAARPDIVSALQAFGPVAAGGLLTLAGTGVLLAGRQVASVDAALRTPYGRALGIKVVLVAAAALLGALTHRRLRSRPVPALRMVGEASCLAAVLACSAVLATAGPARGPAFATTVQAAAPGDPVTAMADDLLVTLDARPNRPGTGFLTLTVLDTRRPAPAPFASVTVRLTDPGGRSRTETPQPSGPNQWQVAGDIFPVAGAWTLGVSVDRALLPTAVLTTGWRVADPRPQPPALPVLVSDRPLTPLTNGGAVLLVTAALLAPRLRRRRSRVPPLAAALDTARPYPVGVRETV